VRDPAVTGGKEDDVLLPIGATGGGNQPFGMHSRNDTLGVVGAMTAASKKRKSLTAPNQATRGVRLAFIAEGRTCCSARSDCKASSTASMPSRSLAVA